MFNRDIERDTDTTEDEMTTYYAANGATRTSKTTVYTHAVLLTGEDASTGSAFAFATSLENAAKAVRTANRRGFTAEIVETTTEAPAAEVTEVEAPRVSLSVLILNSNGSTETVPVATEAEAKTRIHLARKAGHQAIRQMV